MHFTRKAQARVEVAQGKMDFIAGIPTEMEFKI
jgi:hypothetical protein